MSSTTTHTSLPSLSPSSSPNLGHVNLSGPTLLVGALARKLANHLVQRGLPELVVLDAKLALCVLQRCKHAPKVLHAVRWKHKVHVSTVLFEDRAHTHSGYKRLCVCRVMLLRDLDDESVPKPILALRCWGLPRQRRRPATMMLMRLHSASHSYMLCVVSTTDWP